MKGIITNKISPEGLLPGTEVSFGRHNIFTGFSRILVHAGKKDYSVLRSTVEITEAETLEDTLFLQRLQKNSIYGEYLVTFPPVPEILTGGWLTNTESIEFSGEMSIRTLCKTLVGELAKEKGITVFEVQSVWKGSLFAAFEHGKKVTYDYENLAYVLKSVKKHYERRKPHEI